ncbi:MAG TPA: bifunctional UDP-sugar hydrolase/5'-nucleotidase, partial [Bacteroidota bacterium]|nr:bifunctional UDP-sugar hydrolase/5'-nucleotidase [Bacteroidota bacterium]
MKSIRALLLACMAAGASVGQVRTLTILHTNDIHASFVPHEAFWVKTAPRPFVGGFAELRFIVDSIRATKHATLLLDAGDVMTGNPVTEMVYGGAKGGALLAMMDSTGYDIWCPGNHDFDVSQENLRALSRIANFPTVCANLVDTLGRYPVGNVPYVILERGGIRLGVIGLISQELYDLVNQNNLVGLRVLPPAETAQKYIDELKPKTDIVIALTHEGVEEDSRLAAAVHGLALIVGGHSHTRLPHPKLVEGVLIVQAGSNLENLGVLDIAFEGGRITSYDGRLLPLWIREKRPPSPVSVLADSLQEEINRDFDQVLCTLRGDWMRSEGQNAIGTFLADAQREAAGADVGFMNNGGIRRDVAAGPLTKKTLFEILPFRNILTTFQLTGRELRNIMIYNVEKKPGIQIAGMSGRWRKRPDGSVEFASIEVGGKPLDEGRSYACAASDFFVGEGKKYLGVEIRLPVYL